MVELHQEGSAPAACTAGLFQNTQDNDILSVLGLNSGQSVKYSPLPLGVPSGSPQEFQYCSLVRLVIEIFLARLNRSKKIYKLVELTLDLDAKPSFQDMYSDLLFLWHVL